MEKNVSFSFTLIQKIEEISKINETVYEIKDNETCQQQLWSFLRIYQRQLWQQDKSHTFFLSSCSFTCLGALNTQPHSYTQDQKRNARCYKFALIISVLIIQVESRFILSLLQVGLSGAIFTCLLCVLKLNHLFVKSFIKSSLLIFTLFTFCIQFIF